MSKCQDAKNIKMMSTCHKCQEVKMPKMSKCQKKVKRAKCKECQHVEIPKISKYQNAKHVNMSKCTKHRHVNMPKMSTCQNVNIPKMMKCPNAYFNRSVEIMKPFPRNKFGKVKPPSLAYISPGEVGRREVGEGVLFLFQRTDFQSVRMSFSGEF